MNVNKSLSDVAVSAIKEDPKQKTFRGDWGDRFDSKAFTGNYDETKAGHLEHRRIRGIYATSSSDGDRKYETMKSNNRLKATPGNASMPPTVLTQVDTSLYETAIDADNIHSLDNTQQPEQQEIHSSKNVIIAGILIALIVVLAMNFVFLVYKPVVRFFRRRFGRLIDENQTMIERRYKTIDKWLIQKTVQKHDDICRNIKDYSRLKNGESSLGRHTTCFAYDGMLSPICSDVTDSCSPLCLTRSFDTDTTHDCDSSTSSNISSSFHDNNEKDKAETNCTIQIVRDTPEIDDAQLVKRIALSSESEFERHGSVLCSSTVLPPPPRYHNNSTSDENAITQCRSFSLTREQVLDKIEITKSKNDILTTVSRDETEEDQEQECSICMEVFKVGDKISFSPLEGCYHVFHHDCLRRWLLRKTDCPCCRVTMLPIDKPKPKDCDEYDEESPPRVSSPTNSSERRRNRGRRFIRTRSPDRPWYHKNPSVRNERINKKCGIYCCVTCGVVVLKTHLREDLVTKSSSGHGTTRPKTEN